MTTEGPSPEELQAQVQHRLIEELGRSQSRLERLLESLPEAVFQCDEEERFTYVNGVWERILGHTSDELMGSRVIDHVFPDDRARWPGFPEAGGEVEEVELRLVHRSGAPRWFRLTLRTPARASRAGLAHDITERKELEDQLIQSQKMEAVGRLAGGVAHDFNNLLTVITIAAESVAEELAPEHDAREDIAAVLEAAGRASALTRQLLSFGRKQVMTYQDRSLEELMHELRNMLSRLIGPHISIRVESYTERDTVRIDPAHFQQVLLNLAVNARDAMPEGGVLTFRCSAVEPVESTDASGLESGRYVRLSVMDTGVGIEPSQLAHVFEPFYTTKAMGQGTGIGLALVYAIIHQLGGRIEVESRVGEGTNFHMLLPLVESSPAVLEEGETTEMAAGSERVLVVDDDDLVRRLTCKALRRNGYQAEEASSGVQALARLDSSEGAVALLITDVMMPGMSGHALVKQVMTREDPPRVLVMTGYDSTGQELLEGVELLMKPFRPVALLEKVRAILDAA